MKGEARDMKKTSDTPPETMFLCLKAMSIQAVWVWRAEVVCSGLD
jgi:hypothetical protein